MASFSEEDGMLRIPASPARRDYQLRSRDLSSQESECGSPWLPRFQVFHSDSDPITPFWLRESRAAAFDRRGKSLQPNPSPMPAYFSGVALNARGSRQLSPSSLFAGRVPEVRDSSCRDELGDGASGELPYTSYLQRQVGETNRRSGLETSSPTNLRNGNRMRNCVSGELGRSFELAQFKAKAARGYKSGEIVVLGIRADGSFPFPEGHSTVVRDVRKGGLLGEGDGETIRPRRPSGSILWEALNDADNGSSPLNRTPSAAMVPIPFRWEEASGSKVSDSYSLRGSFSISRQARIPSLQQKVQAAAQMSAAAALGDHSKPVAPTARAAKLVMKTSSKKQEQGVSSAVPFKWEVVPGKPKLQEKASNSETPPPALQLPPRLASASFMKRNSSALSSPSAPLNRPRSTHRSLSVSLSSSSKHPHQSHEDSQFPSTPPAARSRALSGALSQFGTLQYQSTDFNNSVCEDSVVAWGRSVRSPTSTLHGPGTPSGSSCSSKSSSSGSRKPSVSFSHSSTSAESFDHWYACGDHASPTSRLRLSYAESQASSYRENSTRGSCHDEGCHFHDHTDGAIIKLRRKLNLRLQSSSKPPRSPIRRAPSRETSASSSGQVEEFFNCQAHALSPSSLPSPARIPINRNLTVEDGEPAATRLPYKMPHDIEPSTVASSPSSPSTRPGPEFSSCLALPRFLSKSETSTPCMWTENPSWNLPKNAPSSSLEDGYRSPAYKATLELLSPSPNLMSKKSGSRSVRIHSSSVRRRHPHLVEVLCNSLKQSLQRYTKRSVGRTHSIVHCDDQFTKLCLYEHCFFMESTIRTALPFEEKVEDLTLRPESSEFTCIRLKCNRQRG